MIVLWTLKKLLAYQLISTWGVLIRTVCYMHEYKANVVFPSTHIICLT